jgi:hypothetical protein
MKTALTLQLIFVVFLSAYTQAQLPAYVPLNGLVGFWPLDSNVNNLGSSTHHGTNTNAIPTVDRFGNLNSAYLLSGNNSFLTLPPSVMGQVGQNNFTISIWVHPDTIISMTNGMEVISDKTRSGWLHKFRIAVGNIANGYSPDSAYWDAIVGSNVVPKVASRGLSNDTWHHLVFVYESTNLGTFKAYHNGAFVGQTTNTSTSFVTNQINVGRALWPNSPINGGFFFKGRVDDIGIWSRALTPQEIILLYFNCAIQGTGNPMSQTTTPNSSVQFTVSTTANVQKQWQMAPASTGVFSNIVNGVNFIGVDSSVLTVRNISSQFNNAQFRCVLTDSVCSTTTTAATLAVNCWDLTSSVPSPATISVGDSAQFSIQSSVPGSQFQWQVYLGNVWNNLADFGQYAGTTTPTLRVRNINYSNHGMRFRCLVSNSGCNDTSGVGDISVLCEPIISRQPQNTTTRINQAAYFHVDTIPGASYQWQRNIGLGFVSLTNGSEFQGVNQPRLMLINALMLDDNSAFRCIVNFAHCQDTSDFAILNVDWGVSTPEIKVTKFYAYPNPAQTTLFINYPDLRKSEEFKFINSLGQVVHTATLQHEHTELDISGLAEGTYTLISGTSRLKIVILKP